MTDADFASREAQVVGSGPRIAPLAQDEIGDDVWELVRELRSSTGGTPPETLSPHLRTVARHPQIFSSQVQTSTALFRGAIPKRERELAILRIAWLTRAPYEWGHHVTIGKRAGLAAEEIGRVVEGSSAPGWNTHEGAILRGVEELLTDHAMSEGTWTTLASAWDETRLIEYLALVGHYLGVAIMQNTLRIQLGPDNSGLASR
jgi:alkylhydroperoxidase family enzyme